MVETWTQLDNHHNHLSQLFLEKIKLANIQVVALVVLKRLKNTREPTNLTKLYHCS